GAGEKFETFIAKPRVTFSIAIAYALIPSYWRAKGYACPATTLYKSLLVRGRGRIVVDPEEQARALQALMEKHQPEGEFTPITPDEPLYRKVLEETKVFCVEPERIDIKTNFGQTLPEKQRWELIRRLEERNEGLDRAAAAEVRKTLETS
ncbi:MAG: pyridoxamine 5'-phosphate oxidase family protein, partial [candidate division Zixibacteria bacterium]|nr:pyridoxamine 5'-phosphate oxidase family protein [candidate division Zixibacteria bacterium]